MLMSRATLDFRMAVRVALVAGVVALLTVAVMSFVFPRAGSPAALPVANPQTIQQFGSGGTAPAQATSKSNTGVLTPVKKTDTFVILDNGAARAAAAGAMQQQDPICPNNEPCGP